MSRALSRFLRGFLPAAVLSLSVPCSLDAQAFATPYRWTGAAGTSDWADPANWQDGSIPPAGGSADTLVILDPVRGKTIALTSDFQFGSLRMAVGNKTPITLYGSTNLVSFGNLVLPTDANLTINERVEILSDSICQWKIGYSPILDATVAPETDDTWAEISGSITGTGGIEKYGVGTLYLSAPENTFMGGVSLYEGTLKLGTGTSMGSGDLTVYGGTLMTHNTSSPVQLGNSINVYATAFTIDTNTPLTISGPVKLNNSPIITVNNTRDNPLMFLRGISDAGAGWSLTFNGCRSATTYLNPNDEYNTYTGGTVINGGSVIFGSGMAVPATGLILVNADGYAGASFYTDVQANFLDHFNKADSTGTIGFDKLPGTDAPDPFVYELIDLTGFNPEVRLGTSTQATLFGAIYTPGGEYRFGGTGVLNVNSVLEGERAVNVAGKSGATPPWVFLNGANTFIGEVYSENAILRFTTSDSLPPSISLTSGSGGYIGYEFPGALTPAQFVGRFAPAFTQGWIGFDSDDGIYTSTDVIDLGAFSPTIGLATTTGFNFAGPILLADGAPYHFLAASTTGMQVASVLDGNHDLLAGHDDGFGTWNGVVSLSGVNTFTGGVFIHSGTLRFDQAASLPAGVAVATAPNPDGVTLSLPGGVFNNSINVDGILHLEAGNDGLPTELLGSLAGSGKITSTGGSQLLLYGAGTFTGEFSVGSVDETGVVTSHHVIVGNNTALQGALVGMQGSSKLDFLTEAPRIIGLSGSDTAVVNLNAGSTLTLADWPAAPATSYEPPAFFGTINGDAGLIIDGRSQRFYGNNTYTGTTVLQNSAHVAVGISATPLGTGPVSVTSGSTLFLDGGPTLSNTVHLNNGRIAGNGTLAQGGDFNVGAGSSLSPGDKGAHGILLFNNATAATNLILGANSNIDCVLDDAGDGSLIWSTFEVNGTITLAPTVTTATPVNLHLITAYDPAIGPTAAQGALIPFDPGVPYVFRVGIASNGLVGFDPSLFNIDTSQFFADMGIGHFTVFDEDIGDGYHALSLQFIPVPEPGTVTLMAIGLALLGACSLRRRKL